MQDRRFRALFRSAIIVTLPVALAGCTPEEEQMIRDAINSAFQAVGNSVTSFAIDFVRQSLAAFLF